MSAMNEPFPTAAPPAETTTPKVSVCVITYNQARYIRQCLTSLVEQCTDFPFEIIVGDDCSTDETTAIVKEFVDRHPGRVRAIVQPRNTGGSRNNLEVHAAARGDYVAHLDGDDYALPGKLQAQADALDNDPHCNAVWHRVDYFDDHGGFCSGLSADLSSFPEGVVGSRDAIRLGFISVFSSLMYRRRARSAVDLDRPILDIYFTWDLLSSGHGRMLDQVLGRYRIAATAASTLGSRRKGHSIAVGHAAQFVESLPGHRRDFMIWALCCGIIDAKNLRRTAWEFFGLAWRCGAWVDPREVWRNLRRMRRTQVQWRARGLPGAPAEIG